MNERFHSTLISGARPPAAVLLFACAVVTGSVHGQLKSPSERIDELEKKLEEVEKDLDKLRKATKKKDKEDFFATGVLTLPREAKLRLGGKAELNLIDTEFDSFPPIGSGAVTGEPDPHVELQRLRIAPVFELNRWVSVQGQIDIEPIEGDTLLKELVARHDAAPVWWFASRFQVGLDDRFIRPNRRTKTYPLVGNAFWRDESLAFTWRMTFGDREGMPADEEEKRAARKPGAEGPGTEGFDAELDGGDAEIEPFDFRNNWGEVRLYLSLGQGYSLDAEDVGFDGAVFNELVQDHRDLENDLNLRELGLGLEYRRSFGKYGDIAVMGFGYNDELREESATFLEQELTLFDPAGTMPISGYGTRTVSRRSYRYGAGAEYFLPASTLFESVLETRGRDGLRLSAQFINGFDGDLERRGWYVQGSYRFSFGRLLLDRYFRSLEPLVRYGRLNVDIRSGLSPSSPVPQLPGTWDREQLLVGGILEVTGDIFVKVEYAFRDERTGARSVGNDELFVQLLLQF